MSSNAAAIVQLPTFPCAAPLTEAVLFGFDAPAFPFRQRVQHHLLPSAPPRVVLRHGPAGSHDEVLLSYGTTLRIGDTFHLWYNGNFGPVTPRAGAERFNCVLCYATSRDGVHWEKPDLGLIEFKGSTRNNIVLDLTAQGHWWSAAIVYEPDDADPARRFKMLFLASGKPAESWVARETRLIRPVARTPVG